MSLHLIASDALQAAKILLFGFFESSVIGIPLTIADMVFIMFVGKHMLPKSGAVNVKVDDEAAAEAKMGNTGSTKQWLTGLLLIMVVVVMALAIKSIPLHISTTIEALFLIVAKCIW